MKKYERDIGLRVGPGGSPGRRQNAASVSPRFPAPSDTADEFSFFVAIRRSNHRKFFISDPTTAGRAARPYPVTKAEGRMEKFKPSNSWT